MVITINQKEYELHFGWAFLRYMNKNSGFEVEEISMDTGGLPKLTLGAELQDPETMVKIIKAGTDTEKQKPSNLEIEQYVETLIMEENYSDVFDEMWEEIKKQPLLAQAMKGKNKAAKMKLM